MKQTETVQLIKNDDYVAFIKDVKHRIQSAQIKAAVRVNQSLLFLYWYLGEQIIEKQKEAKWGDAFLEQMSRDLRDEFPAMKGFSYRNLRLIRQWVFYWISIWQQLVAKLHWGHTVLIFSKIKDKNIRNFEIQFSFLFLFTSILYNKISSLSKILMLFDFPLSL